MPSLIWDLNYPSRLPPSRGFLPQCCQALNPHIMPSPSMDIGLLLLSLVIHTHRCPSYPAWTDTLGLLKLCAKLSPHMDTLLSLLKLSMLSVELPCPPTFSQRGHVPSSATSNGFTTRLFGKRRTYFIYFFILDRYCSKVFLCPNKLAQSKLLFLKWFFFSKSINNNIVLEMLQDTPSLNYIYSFDTWQKGRCQENKYVCLAC